MWERKAQTPDTESRAELLIDVQRMSKIYNEGRENEVRALDDISLQVSWGEFLCILGQSGSGKSTLMNILGCLDIPTYGSYHLNGQPVSDMKPSVLSGIRCCTTMRRSIICMARRRFRHCVPLCWLWAICAAER